MQLEESLNNRAWPDRDALSPAYPPGGRDNPFVAQQAAAQESANNAAADGPAGGGWLLGLRSFLPLPDFGGAAGPSLAAHALHDTQPPGAYGAVSRAAPLQWLPGSEHIAQLPAERSGWPAHSGTSAMDTDPPTQHQAQPALDWCAQLGGTLGADPVAQQPFPLSREPDGGGSHSGADLPVHGARRMPVVSPQQQALPSSLGEAQQPSVEAGAADARGGSGGDGSLVSSATAMQDSAGVRVSPVLRALDSCGVPAALDPVARQQSAGPSSSGEPTLLLVALSRCSCASRSSSRMPYVHQW